MNRQKTVDLGSGYIVKRIVYNKLVRDKIPEIIKASGKTAIIEKLDDEEFKCFLLKKLIEESEELMNNPSYEELADVCEVIEEIIVSFNFDKEKLQNVKNNKAEKNGSFKKRILLKEIK